MATKTTPEPATKPRTKRAREPVEETPRLTLSDLLSEEENQPPYCGGFPFTFPRPRIGAVTDGLEQ